MRLFSLTLALTISKEILIIVVAIDCLNSIGNHISQNIRPHQITFFINNQQTVNVYKENFVIQKTTQGIPFVLKEFKKFIITNEKRTLNSSSARYSESLNIILYDTLDDVLDESELNRLKDFIDIVDLWFAKLMRPKCLVIMINNKLPAKNYFNSLFKYAWKKKFMDFSVAEIGLVNVSRANNCIINSYNPFCSVFTETSFDGTTPLEIFPDKLRNANGYKLKLGVVSSDMFIIPTRDQKDNVVDVSGQYSYIISFVLRHMNFSINFYEVGTSNPLEYMNASVLKYEKLESGELNLEAAPNLMTANDSFQVLDLDFGMNCVKTIAVVPMITHYYRLIIPWNSFLIVFMLLINRIALLSSIAKTTNLTTLDLLRVLLGIPMSVYSRKFISSLVFVTCFFVSLVYSTYFYSDLVNTKFAKQDIDFDTFKSIDESGLKIYAHEFTFFVAFGSHNVSDKHLQNIKEKLILTDLHGLVSCLERLVKSKDSICLMSVPLAELFIQNLSGSVSGKLKFAKPVFACATWKIKFEKASVFIVKFQQILQTFYESGINRVLEPRKKHEDEFPMYKEKEKANYILASQLVLILFGGYAISFSVFLVELISKTRLFYVKERQ